MLEAGEQKHSLTTLWQAEGSRIDDAVGPSISEVFQLGNDHLQCTSAAKLEHERHVLDQQPRDPLLAEQPEDLADQP